MVYVVGVIGLVGGFLFGLMVLQFLTRHKSRAELLSDPYIKWKYGLLCWGIAALGCYSFIEIYRQYF